MKKTGDLKNRHEGDQDQEDQQQEDGLWWKEDSQQIWRSYICCAVGYKDRVKNELLKNERTDDGHKGTQKDEDEYIMEILFEQHESILQEYFEIRKKLCNYFL